MAWTLCVWMALLLPHQDGANGRQRAGIAAKINGEIVTWEEIELSLRAHRPEERTDELRQAELRRLAEEKLFLQFARKYNINVTDQELDDAIRRDKKLLGGDEKFEDYLRFLNKTMTQYRDDRRRTVMINNLYRRLVMEGIRNPNLRTVLLWENVSPEEIREYYRNNMEQFKAIQHITVWRIGLLFAGEREKELKMRLAESLQRKLAEGSDFLVLAHYYSETLRTDANGKKVAGHMELKREDSEFEPSTTAYLFDTMKEGELSPIIVDRNSINIFKLEKRVDRKAETFEEAQFTIRSWLEHRKREENRILLRDELLKQSYIEPRNLFDE